MYPIIDTHGFGLTASGVTDHCAIQWLRRVRTDPDALGWAPRGHVIDREREIPSPVLLALPRAKAEIAAMTPVGSLSIEPPAWCAPEQVPTRPGARYLSIGDDVTVVVGWWIDRRNPRGGRRRWIAVTTFVRHAPDARASRVRTAERREARAARGRRGIVPFGGRPRADPAESRNALRRVYCG